jgi:hypothetical protein
MKIRNGFVSNSSSSSFCIVGVSLEGDEFEKAASLKRTDDEEYIDRYEQFEILCKKKKVSDLEFFTDEDDYVFIGKDIFSMKDSETMGEFKNRTLKDFNKILPKLKTKPSLMVEYISN